MQGRTLGIRESWDGERKLCAAVLLLAVQDAQRGDVIAARWLEEGGGGVWAEYLDIAADLMRCWQDARLWTRAAGKAGLSPEERRLHKNEYMRKLRMRRREGQQYVPAVLQTTGRERNRTMNATIDDGQAQAAEKAADEAERRARFLALHADVCEQLTAMEPLLAEWSRAYGYGSVGLPDGSAAYIKRVAAAVPGLARRLEMYPRERARVLADRARDDRKQQMYIDREKARLAKLEQERAYEEKMQETLAERERRAAVLRQKAEEEANRNPDALTGWE